MFNFDEGVCVAHGIMLGLRGHNLTESILGLEVSLVSVYSIGREKWFTENHVYDLLLKPHTLSENPSFSYCFVL